MELVKDYRFEAAHLLPHVPDGHKCGRLHGHSYNIAVHVEGQPEPASGWVIDYSEISAVAGPVIEALDHNYLNEVPGLDNPTSEVLAKWLWERLRADLPALSAITVRETCTSSCVFRGE